MTKLTTFIATALCLFGLGAWAYIAPTPGAGWLLVLTICGAWNISSNFKDPELKAVFATTITIAAAVIWWTHQTVPHNGWVLVLAIFSALAAFNAFGSTPAKKKKAPNVPLKQPEKSRPPFDLKKK